METYFTLYAQNPDNPRSDLKSLGDFEKPPLEEALQYADQHDHPIHLLVIAEYFREDDEQIRSMSAEEWLQ